MAKLTKEGFIAATLGTVLALSVFGQGMYNEGARYIFWIVSALIFTYAVIKLKINIRPSSSAERFVIFAVAVYALCTFSAVSVWDSLTCVFRYVGIYVFCILVKRIVSGNFKHFVFPLYFISTVAAVVGIVQSLIPVSGTYDSFKGLLLSVFHYHNASAIYFSCMFLLGIYIAFTVSGKILKALVFGCNFLFLSTVLYTQSRGSWLVLAAGIVLFLILNRKHEGFSDFIYSIIALVLSVALVMNGFMSAFSARNAEYVCEKPGMCILFTLLGFAIAAGLSFFSEIKPVKKVFTPKRVLCMLPVIAALAVVAIIFFMPQTLADRIRGFSLSSATVSERVTFFKDSFKIFAQQPLLGIGGDGWQYVYPNVQTCPYTVAHPHSYFAEMMTDAGIFGILLYTFLIFTFISAFIKCKKNLEISSMITICFMILAHTLFDFDTDYYTIQLLLFSALILISPSKEEKENFSKWIIAVPACLLAWTAVNGFAYLNYSYAVENAEADNAAEMYVYTKRTVAVMPIKVEYLVTHANVTLGRSAGEQKYMYEAKKCLDRAYSLNRYNYETITQQAIYQIRCGDYEDAWDTIDTLVDLQPFVAETYMRIRAIYYEYSIIPMASRVSAENAELLRTACERFEASVNRAYPIAEKNNTKIDVVHEVTDALEISKDVIRQLDDMGV